MAIHFWNTGAADQSAAPAELVAFSAPATEPVATADGRLEELALQAPDEASEGIPFTSIGLGKPLSIRIHTAYVGDLRTWFNRRTDVLLVSGIKAPQTFDAVGRTINAIQPGVKDHEYMEFAAFDKGSPLVYYTNSVTDFNLSVSFELVPDSFDDRSLSKLASLFQLAGGLPVFAPAASYLLAGSVVSNMAKDLGKAFIESAPTLRDTLKLNFGVAGLPRFEPGFYVITNDGDFQNPDAYEIQQHQSGPGRFDVRLCDKTTKKPYRGKIPYLIIGVDGQSEPQLEQYEPHLATAAVLEKFYPSSDGIGVVMSELGEAVTLYNDLQSRKQAEDLKERLDAIDPSDSEYERLKSLYDAHRKNIRQKLLQIPDTP